jgi:CheY-like chemotaxis protein
VKKKVPKKVLVIEDHQETFNRIVLEFANRGYHLFAAKTGVDGLEQAIMSPPDMILVKLVLPDLPGDVVALKLKRLPKTMDVPLILYRHYDGRDEFSIEENLYTVEKNLCKKAGIEHIVESDDPQILLKEAERIWEEKEGI